jgi:hypothetical protein
LADAARTVGVLRLQAAWCARLGSPLYAALCAAAADDVAAGGPLAAVLAGHEDDPPATVLALRLLGAAHRLVLEGEAPALARHYPSAGGDGDPEGAWAALRALATERGAELRALLGRPVQTNEVGRAAALLGGFLTVARETRRPLRLLELGASAGLNLRWDYFRYEGPGGAWGDPGSPVVLRGAWEDTPPPLDGAATVVERAGCDPSPVAPATEEGRLTLLSYLWPDQPARVDLLRGALAVARRVPTSVERADAAAWLRSRLAAPMPGVATVVFHSIVIQYLDATSREGVLATIAAAGARATPQAPLAWLRMEPGGDETEVRLTLWPGGERLLATAGFHGRPVRWLARGGSAPPGT